MGLVDALSAEDRVQVKFSEFYALVKAGAKLEILMNGVMCDVPHRYLREMMRGMSEKPEENPVVEGEEKA